MRYGKRLLWYEYTDRVTWLLEQKRYAEAAGVAREALYQAQRKFGCGRKHPYVQFQLGRLVRILTKLAVASQREARVPPELRLAA